LERRLFGNQSANALAMKKLALPILLKFRAIAVSPGHE